MSNIKSYTVSYAYDIVLIRTLYLNTNVLCNHVLDDILSGASRISYKTYYASSAHTTRVRFRMLPGPVSSYLFAARKLTRDQN